MKHLHAVILAGGSGKRLWPLSTPGFPKQFLPLPSGKTMIQETLARVAPFICHKDHVQRVKELAENEQKFQRACQMFPMCYNIYNIIGAVL